MITKYESAVKHATTQAGLTGVQYVGYENPFNAKKDSQYPGIWSTPPQSVFSYSAGGKVSMTIESIIILLKADASKTKSEQEVTLWNNAETKLLTFIRALEGYTGAGVNVTAMGRTDYLNWGGSVDMVLGIRMSGVKLTITCGL